MTVLWLLLGLALAAPYLAVGRRKTGRAARVWWAVGLVAVALVYVGFAAAAGEGLGLEVLGVAVFGTFAAMGVRGARGWLAAGWLLHPLWDLGLHGDGGVAPLWYVWACLSFDVAVGGWLWLRGLRR